MLSTEEWRLMSHSWCSHHGPSPSLLHHCSYLPFQHDSYFCKSAMIKLLPNNYINPQHGQKIYQIICFCPGVRKKKSSFSSHSCFLVKERLLWSYIMRQPAFNKFSDRHQSWRFLWRRPRMSELWGFRLIKQMHGVFSAAKWSYTKRPALNQATCKIQ